MIETFSQEVVDAAAPARTPPRVGDHIGPYRLVRALGAGTGGHVFEVLHEKLGRGAALKLLDAAVAKRPEARGRFLAEALSISRINHPHIVEVTDIVETGGDDDRVVGIVMELLEGQSLGAAMTREGPMPPERFLPILAEVCDALAAAHGAGFVHRDLKPENVFLCDRHGASDFVKLLDFGLAAPLARTRTDVDASDADLGSGVRRGPFVGTPAYASPEQASGGAVDHTTDLYAVGVMLYELACGRLPFEGWSVGEFLIQHQSAPVPRLPVEMCATPLGRALDAVVQGCMAKRASDRFPSAGELASTLRALARGEIVPIVTAATPLRRPRGRRALALGATAALALAAIAGGRALLRPATHVAPHATAAAGGAPAAPAFVTLVFDSDPAGVEVRAVADGALLGVTPFKRAFRRAPEALVVDLVRRGYAPVRLTLSTTASRTINATMALRVRAPRRKTAPASRGWAKRAFGSEKTLNPFSR
ncbi:MAG TPA: serine/threonine-protein kinase [Polyangia bacterium]|nr:serine/threonine-protein kinase [Polyangia bacterium]